MKKLLVFSATHLKIAQLRTVIVLPGNSDIFLLIPARA